MTTTLEPQSIGHCKRCKFQWVIPNVAKGKKTSTYNGHACPVCKSKFVHYTSETTR